MVQSATETETGLATKLSLTDADRGSTTLAVMVGDEFPVIQVESPKRSLPAKVQLRFTGTIVALSKEEERVQAQQVMAAAIDAAADGFTIGFNLYYLLSFVKAVDSSALQMDMGSAGGLVKLRAAGDTPQVELPMEIVYYLMPMQQRPKQ